MKAKGYALLAAALMVSLAAHDAMAQRRGRGGGGRPSISRPASSRPTPGKSPAKLPASKPAAGKLPGGKIPGGKAGLGALPGGAGRPSAADLKQFLSLPAQRPATLPSPGGKPPAIGGGKVPGGKNPYHVNRAQINQQISARYANGARRPFTQSWWGGWPTHLPARPWHPWYRPHWGRGPNYWWRWATPVALTGWVAYHWVTPVYYTYGSGGNVYYENNTVYVDGQPYASSAEYYQQADTIADGVPEMNDQQAAQVEWLPLGVFAVTREGAEEAKFLLQLAVSKEGILSGTLTNQETGSVRPVEGTVDKNTQRAAWKFVAGDDGQTEVVMETSVYNLTKDESTALVHFGPDRTETAVLVRLDPPAEK